MKQGVPWPNTQEAWSAFYERHAEKLYRVARANCHGKPEVVREIVNFAFTQAFRKPPRDRSTPVPWLVRVVINEAMRRCREPVHAPVPLDDARATATQRSEIDLAELRIDLVGALRQLPEKQRLYVVLRFFWDMPFEQIAEVSGLAGASSARGAVRDALKNLRKAFGSK